MSTKVDEKWQGPLPPDDLPQQGLDRVRITVRHGVSRDREAAVTDALSPIMGKARVIHYAVVRKGLSWNKPRWKALVSVGRRRLRLRATHLKASQIRTLVEGLATLEGACDLRIQGERNGRA